MQLILSSLCNKTLSLQLENSAVVSFSRDFMITLKSNMGHVQVSLAISAVS